jgi:hypothetical protein
MRVGMPVLDSGERGHHHPDKPCPHSDLSVVLGTATRGRGLGRRRSPAHPGGSLYPTFAYSRASGVLPSALVQRTTSNAQAVPSDHCSEGHARRCPNWLAPTHRAVCVSSSLPSTLTAGGQRAICTSNIP